MEKPILFCGDMVRAILDGRKTMTRRIAKGVPDPTHWVEQNEDGSFAFMYGIYGDGWMGDASIDIMPRYQVGDILWVRETFTEFHNPEHCYKYKADGIDYAPWRPSIFMPKEATRIWLKVTDVRCEGLQDITEEDAIAEGIRIGMGGSPYFNCIDAYHALWDSLNKSRGYSWDSNPFVFCYTFEPCDKPAKEAEHE
jgi:hypothetical protein